MNALAIALPACVALQRVLELAHSRRNRRATRDVPGADAEPRSAFAAMVMAHAALVVLPPLEAALWPTEWPFAAGAGALVVFAAAQVLRYWAIRSLGKAWNVAAHVTPDLGVCARGPYRWIRHPNYLAVLLEFAAVPLALGSWRSFLLLNALHTPVLFLRIRREERLLFRVPGYAAAMGSKGRFLPHVFAPAEARA
ncbi:MAG: hypothetical protein HZA53_04985 [Planctomycetes bacterium]|nr:hypothetical protein [Planctomycetota bacterium]